MTRWKAAAIHLSINGAIGLLSAALIFGVWYPPPYSHAAGADELVVLLLGVDCVLGPLLTLVVFKAGKKSLRFDLGVIAMIQACAFVYGISVVVRARPIFIVAVIDHLVLVSADEIDLVDLRKGSKPEFRTASWTGPRLVGAIVPIDADERSFLVQQSMKGKDVQNFPKYYVDYSEVAPLILAHAERLDDLHNAHQAMLAEAVRKAQSLNADLVWLPIFAREHEMIALLDCTNGAYKGAADINP